MPARAPRRSSEPVPDQLALAFDLPVPAARSAPLAPRPSAAPPAPVHGAPPGAGQGPTQGPSPRLGIGHPHAPVPDHRHGAAPGQVRETAHPVPSTPAIHRHPRANRELRLGEHLIGYELRRARRRSIGFVVGGEGLAVSAPRWVGQSEIDTALLGKASWILRKLLDQADRQKRIAAARIPWGEGAELPFLGAPLRLTLDPRVIGAQIAAAEPGGQRLLRVGLAASAEPAQIRDAVQSWLQRQARALFDERVRHFAPRLGVSIKRLSLSSATTRWGSASSNGTIRLNWRLIHHALPTIDYVVVHELAHLREMNHSPAFWDVVRSVIPDVDVHRGTLKDETLPVME